MTPYLLLTALTLLAAAAVATRAHAAEPSPGAVINEAIVATWNCQDRLIANGALEKRTPAKPSPWAVGKHSRGWQAAYLNKWLLRHNKCRAALAEIKRQWNWQAWLPQHWYRVGSCETGYGGPPNWQHNSGTYQGAFGFYHGSWDAFKNPGYPADAHHATPWQQYQVALNIYNRYGMSGWGCKG